MGSWIVVLSTQLYRALIATYPPAFRRAYAGPMTQVFRDKCRATSVRHGSVGVIQLLAASLVDLLRGALAERFPRSPAPGSGRAPTPPEPNDGRRRSTFDSVVRDALIDVKYAVRTLRTRPGLVVAAVITLALGIGANTSIYTVVNGVLLRPLPYAAPEQLVSVQRIRPNGLTGQLSYPDVVSVREQTGVFTGMAGFSASEVDLVGVDEPGRLEVARVTAGFFDVLGITPAMGRLLRPDDHGQDGRRVAVVSDAAWRQRFGGDSDIVGRQINLLDRPYTIVGVLGAEVVEFPDPNVELWIPTNSNFGLGSFWLSGVARLADDITIGQAQAELDLMAGRIADEHPEIYADRGFMVRGLREAMVGDVRVLLLVLLGAVGLVLLIAAANVANLMLVRATERQREMAVRAALGAARFRIVRQLLTESVLLAAVGGTLGLLVAQGTTSALLRFGPVELPRRLEIGLDANVLLFTALVVLGTGFIFGLAPVFQLPIAHLSDALRDGTAGSGGGRRRVRLRHGLAALQVALSCVLLIGAGLLAKSFWRLSQVDPGFHVENVLTFRVSTAASVYPTRESIERIHVEVTEAMATLPGVEQVASVSLVPFHGGNWCNTLSVTAYPENEMSCAEFRMSAPGYFGLMGIDLLRGRDFRPGDDAGSPAVTIVNETAARTGWPGESAVGQRIDMQGASREIIGVVSDVRQFSLDRPVMPEVYVPRAQFPLRYARYVVRTSLDPVDLMPAVRARVWAVDPNLPLAELATLETMVSESVNEPRFRTVLLGGIAALALTLSIVGLFAVMAFSVSQHTREIGIRVALGANRATVLSEVLGQGSRLIVTGCLLGLVGAYAATRVLRGFLFGIEASDPWVFAVGIGIVIATGLLACYLPARRATQVDPVIALRYE